MSASTNRQSVDDGMVAQKIQEELWHRTKKKIVPRLFEFLPVEHDGLTICDAQGHYFECFEKWLVALTTDPTVLLIQDL